MKNEASMFDKKAETTPKQEVEHGESVKSLFVSREQIEEIGNIFNNPYLLNFTKAVAEGKTFKEADKSAKEESKASGNEDNGYAYGDIMSYKNNGAELCVFIDDHRGNFEFIYPANISVADALNQLAQKPKQE